MLDETRVALALITMVVRVQHPFDLLHTDLGEVVEYRAAAGVDEQRGLPVLEEEDVAGIAKPEQVRRKLREGAIHRPSTVSSRAGLATRICATWAASSPSSNSSGTTWRGMWA